MHFVAEDGLLSFTSRINAGPMNRSTYACVVAGEGIEPSFSSSKPDVLPVTPSRKTWSPLRVTCSLTLTHPHRIDRWSRRQELNLRFSIISRASCRWTTPRLVDPTRLKRAPHGLKGRRSVSRAPDQKMAVAEGLEPSHVGLTIRCITNLATPQNDWKTVFRTRILHMVAMGGFEPPTSRL